MPTEKFIKINKNAMKIHGFEPNEVVPSSSVNVARGNRAARQAKGLVTSTVLVVPSSCKEIVLLMTAENGKASHKLLGNRALDSMVRALYVNQ